MSEQVLSRLFEPFFTTKEVGEGSGLGLAVVHGIVEQHGGFIHVRSIPGAGTTFALFFPTTTEQPAPLPVDKMLASDPSPARRRRQTILLAEDEEAVRELARLLLEQAGFQVLEAPDGVKALKLWEVHENEVSLLLTDMVMPNGITGRQLAQKIHQRNPRLPVVYASGYSVELTAPDFCESATEVFLAKPYTGEQLVGAIRRLLDQYDCDNTTTETMQTHTPASAETPVAVDSTLRDRPTNQPPSDRQPLLFEM
jgi:CheY-like chemotaxis protein